MIRVLLIDDHDLFRAGLARLFDEIQDIRIIAESSDGNQGVALAIERQPDVALIDLQLQGTDGINITRIMSQCAPKVRSLILTQYEEEMYVMRALAAGAKGYITKRSAPHQLIKAIRRIHQGSIYLATETAENLNFLRSRYRPDRATVLGDLSPRELQVLKRLAIGNSIQKIASDYKISTNTAKTYRARLLKKLDLHNNVELVHFAIKHRLISPYFNTDSSHLENISKN